MTIYSQKINNCLPNELFSMSESLGKSSLSVSDSANEAQKVYTYTKHVKNDTDDETAIVDKYRSNQLI